MSDKTVQLYKSSKQGQKSFAPFLPGIYHFLNVYVFPPLYTQYFLGHGESSVSLGQRIILWPMELSRSEYW